MAIYYKGAGPGTHWHRNNPQSSGAGFTTSGASVHSIPAMITHVVNASFPSPYLSFSASFAVARAYALTGPAGVATTAAPGLVFEVDTSLAKGVTFYDPLIEIAKLLTPPAKQGAGVAAHHHDGGQDLLLAIVNPGLHGGILTAAAPRKGSGVMARPPSFQSELDCLTKVLRDAEVLAHGNVPVQAILRVWSVS